MKQAEADYKEMYLNLFNEVSAVIEILKDVQRQTEKMYIEASAANIMT